MQQDQPKQSVQPSQVQASSNNVPSVPKEQSYVYGDFWTRLIALFIDGLIVGAFQFVVILIFIPIFGISVAGLFTTVEPNQEQFNAASAGFFAIFSLLFLILFLIYEAYFVILTSKYGATWGKKALGLRVIDESGNNISIGKAILREVIGKWISSAVFDLGYIWAAFDEKMQTWHDKIASTYVIKK